MAIEIKMKGFPPRIRTEANFYLLSEPRAKSKAPCLHKWVEVDVKRDDGSLGPGRRIVERASACHKCGTIEWQQLEKIRTLARLGFRRGPAMRVVQKSFQTAYHKRVLLEGGGTRSVSLDEWDEQ